MSAVYPTVAQFAGDELDATSHGWWQLLSISDRLDVPALVARVDETLAGDTRKPLIIRELLRAGLMAMLAQDPDVAGQAIDTVPGLVELGERYGI